MMDYAEFERMAIDNSVKLIMAMAEELVGFDRQTTVLENCEDIYADAKTINETKYNTEEVVLDSVDENEEA